MTVVYVWVYVSVCVWCGMGIRVYVRCDSGVYVWVYVSVCVVWDGDTNVYKM